MGPDIDPNKLATIDPVPAISVEQAKSIFWQHFKVELGWEREYGDDEEHSYRLVYKPVYPHFIDAHTGSLSSAYGETAKSHAIASDIEESM